MKSQESENQMCDVPRCPYGEPSRHFMSDHPVGEMQNKNIGVPGSELRPTPAIYVASRASVPERGQMWRSFRREGVPITSSWIDEDGDGETGDWRDLWERIENEIKDSTALVLYAEAADFPLKGALIEAGIALGFGVPVVICLPDSLPDYHWRPIGSWINHPNVFGPVSDIREAIKIALNLLTCQREGGSVSQDVAATVPSQPSPESTEADELWTRLADALEFIRNDKAYANAQGIIAALRVKSLTPVSESLTPDVQGKLVEALRSIRDHPHNSYEVSSVEVADGHRCAANIAREALALLDGQDQKIN